MLTEFSKSHFSNKTKIVSFLGKGQYGKVYTGYYLNQNINQNSLVVIKICKLNSSRIDEEVNILKTISFKHIVKYIDSFIDNGLQYIILEYLRGPTMYDYIQDNIINEKEALHYVKQIAKALIYLNLKNIFHGDIKAENIILTPNLQGEKNSPNHKTLQSDTLSLTNYKCVKLIDFGHSVCFQPDEKFNRMTGSLFYLSPEIVNRKPYDYRIDIWALGILYYEMLYTLPPFYSEDDNEVFDLISLGEYSFPELPYVSTKSKNNISQFLKKADTRIQLHNILDL